MGQGTSELFHGTQGSNCYIATSVSVANKLDAYLLNLNHPHGKSKAEWFGKALGFTKDNANELARQVIFDPQKASATEKNVYGQKYSQIIPITGFNGKTINVEFIWVKGIDGVVKLVTAIPTKKGE
jgi:filamentous hemagglutinin